MSVVSPVPAEDRAGDLHHLQKVSGPSRSFLANGVARVFTTSIAIIALAPCGTFAVNSPKSDATHAADITHTDKNETDNRTNFSSTRG